MTTVKGIIPLVLILNRNSNSILFRIDFQQEYFNKLLTYCRQLVINGNIALENVDKMEK
jgi:hypothetical protein